MCEFSCRCAGVSSVICIVSLLACDPCFFVRLFQVKIEREQYQTEIRDLQDQLSEMHDELDTAKKSVADGEKTVMMAVTHLPLFDFSFWTIRYKLSLFNRT